ncbi:hypothetical protein BDC45DRAFT_567900 [Circinella umbellata]|nr:hypothetical protein BDC45DRAFT_567900 [Circinella umbellata]
MHRRIGDLPLGVPEELDECFQGLGGLKTSGDSFKYSRKIDIDDPKNELLKVWFCNEVEKISSLFLKTGSFNIGELIESDQLYVGFGFFSSIFRGSNIVAKETELSSKANATFINQNRLLSSTDPIQNRKMGRRGDTIFSCRDIELGCTEIGAEKDQTKGIRDSMLKIPIVLRGINGNMFLRRFD